MRLGLHQRLRDQEVGRGVRLPRRGVVLADPGLGKAELVGPAQGLQVPAVALEQAALRRVRGHREQAVLHRRSPGCWSMGEPILRDEQHVRTRSLRNDRRLSDVSICKQIPVVAAFFLP